MKKALGWIFIAGVVLWIAGFFMLKAAHDQTTDSMIAVANQLDVSEDWTLVSEVIESEKLVCLNANPCPSLNRTWQADGELQIGDLQRLGETAGWDMEVEGDCRRPVGAIGKRSVCNRNRNRNRGRLSGLVARGQPGGGRGKSRVAPP